MMDPTSSLADLSVFFRTKGVLSSDAYLQDQHFERWVLPALDTEQSVSDFLKHLDQAHGACPKAQHVRDWMAQDFCAWMPRPRAAQLALSKARRVCCRCHETGSFARRP